MGYFNSFIDKNAGKKSNCKIDNLTERRLQGANGSNEEYSLDITDEIQNNDIISCSKNGVVFHDIPNMIKIVYDGVLAKSGAEEIYAVIGYGDNNDWQDIGQLPMQKTAEQTFELLTFRKRQGNVNIAFKDGAQNWDNNFGSNYIFYGSKS